MKYFKDEAGNLYVDPIVENHKGLIEVDATEFSSLVEIKNTPTQAELDERRVAEINKRLTEIDIESIRSLRANARGQVGAFEAEKLDTLEAEAEALRAELGSLS